MFFELFENAEAKQVSCESVGKNAWGFGIGSVKTCFMERTTVIDEDNVSISTFDENIGGLLFRRNKKIIFLPVKVAEAFPNLELYSAWDCSVTQISRENFAGLRKLKILHLEVNQIEKIQSDTFKNLVSLEILHLCKKIKVLLFS